MPVKRQDAHRALELLEDYHGRLTAAEDKQLRLAIEKVIKIFKSRLFQALLDIQEFYEVTLLDENKSTDQKTMETIKVAERWTAAPGLTNPISGADRKPQLKPRMEPSVEETVQATSAASVSADPRMKSPPVSSKPLSKDLNGSHALPQETLSAISDDWQLFEVVLHRGSGGFGFSIAGGVDAPHIPDDPAIYVTKVVPGGAADLDGRMQLNDCILRVNQMDVSSVAHNTAVDSLKRAGNQLHLLIRRPVANVFNSTHSGQTYEVILKKGDRGLGFSIAGGLGNDHIPGDSGIFITKVIEGGTAALDGRIGMGDRLIAVNDHNLDGVRHEDAVAALKSCGQEVLLVLVKAGAAQIEAMNEAEERAAMIAAGHEFALDSQDIHGSLESNTTGVDKKSKKEKSKKKKLKDR